MKEVGRPVKAMLLDVPDLLPDEVFIYLFICLSVCYPLYVCLSVYVLSIYLSIDRSIYLHICLYQSIYLSTIDLSIYQPVKAMLLDVPNLLPDEVRYR